MALSRHGVSAHDPKWTCGAFIAAAESREDLLLHHLTAGSKDKLLVRSGPQLTSRCLAGSPIQRKVTMARRPSVCQGSPPPFLPSSSAWKPSIHSTDCTM